MRYHCRYQIVDDTIEPRVVIVDTKVLTCNAVLVESIFPYRSRGISMATYKFLRFGVREEKTFGTVEEALESAIDDMNTGSAAPLEIAEEGRVVLERSAIKEKFNQESGMPPEAYIPQDKPYRKFGPN